MTAEMNESNGVLEEGEKAAVELGGGKNAADLSPCGEDLANAAADCNGIVEGSEEESRVEAKDDPDSSYVFVNGGSDDHGDRDLDVVDPILDTGMNSITKGESNGEDVVVSSEELKDEGKRKNVENGSVEERIVSSVVESDELREESVVESAGIVDGLVSSNDSNGIVEVEKNSIEVEEKQECLNKFREGFEPGELRDEGVAVVSTNDTVEVEKKLESSLEVEEKQESQITVREGFESGELRDEGVADVDMNDTVEVEKKLESSLEVEEKWESQMTVREGIEPEELRDGGVADVDMNDTVEVENKLESSPEVDENRETEITVAEGFEPEDLRDKDVADVDPTDIVEVEKKLESSLEVEEKGDHVTLMEGVRSEELSEESVVENVPVIDENVSSTIVDSLCVNENRGEDIDANNIVEVEKKLEFAVEVEDKHESQFTATEGVESDSSLHDKGNEMETSTITSEILVEGERSSGDLVMELEMNAGNVNSFMDDTKLETIAGESPAEHAESYAESRNGSVENQSLEIEVRKSSDENDNLEAENGYNEGEESKPSGSVEVLKAEVEVTYLPVDGAQVIPSCSTHNLGLESQVRHFPLESSESITCSPIDEAGETFLSCAVIEESETECKNNGHVGSGEGLRTSSVDEPNSTNQAANGYAKTTEILVTSPADNLKLDTEATNINGNCSETLRACPIDEESVTKVRIGYDENGEGLPACPLDEEPLADVQKDLVDGSEDMEMCIVGDVKSESEAKGDLVEGSQSAPECIDNEVDVENDDRSTNRDDGDDKTAFEEAQSVDGIPLDVALKPSQEDSSPSASDGMKVDAEGGKKLPNYIIRIPRYVDDKIRSKIDLTQVQVEEKTRHRDVIRIAMQQKKATCSELREKFDAAKLEERTARDAVIAKHRDMHSVQSVLNRIKNATSVEEIEERIINMEHMIEHETMPLKEEKQLIREIKQLKSVREQISANMGTQAEIQQAFDQRESTEERSKLFKKELDSLKEEVLRTEDITKAAKKKHYDECEKLRELQAQYKAADALRQEAYAHLQNLKRQLYEKNKYFRMYKEDERKAVDYALKGEREALQCFCTNQVEKFMELWNNNDEFRKDYVKHNTMSTVRRFKTLDGRSLAPGEEPTVLQNPRVGRINDAHLASVEIATSPAISATEMKPENPSATVALKETVAKPDVGLKKSAVKSKKAVKQTSAETVTEVVSRREETVEDTEKDCKRKKEEEEMARKAEELTRKEEELRREEAAAKLKEQRRLEEMAKAKEAEERKRRNAEKAQARAELRARREAELKEKEREKRLRKKERKAAAASTASAATIEGESAEVLENTKQESSQDSEPREKPAVVSKRPPPKSLPAAKQTKAKPLPMPLRNRGKRRMQSWMWVVLAALLIFALFWVGNHLSSKFTLPAFGFWE